jgi:basic amino acid/polyamine antiporter, APA family
MTATGDARLEKHLGLVDVYAICTGAMFASGFFLLPGIAAANAGPSVILAYAISSLLMVPAMYSIAELSSAMPRAAGTYFFVHRSLGPLAGTVGGLGAWLVLIAKSAFALVGMGAYLALFFDIPVQPLAIALTVAFGVLNVLGAKETARLQVWLVAVLVAIMVFFIAAGAIEIWRGDLVGVEAGGGELTPFLPYGLEGLVATIGLVFISYAGLTKVASTAEEVRDPDRNLPLGMLLALVTVGVIYTAGVAILVAVLPSDELADDLTPVASAGDVVFGWMPGPIGIGLVVVAAITAFASTGNAGILTASRYPLAMARDRLLWGGFDRVGRFGTPTLAVIVTCAAMIALILFLDVERLASLGSAFLLLLFALINLAVILMRESRLSSYAPGFRSPFYPWMQIIGVVTTLGLIPVLGAFYLVFILVIVVLSAIWYRVYVRSRVSNRAAIYGLFRRLGERHDAGIDEELWSILQERGASEQDSFDELVTRGHVLDLEGVVGLDEVLRDVAGELRGELRRSMPGLDEALATAVSQGIVPDGSGAVVCDVTRDDLDRPEVVLVRVKRGVRVTRGRRFPGSPGGEEEETGDSLRAQALLFLFAPQGRVTQHLRLLAQLVSMVEVDGFATTWRRAHDEQALLETLIRDERFASVVVGAHGPPAEMVDRRMRDVEWPGDTLVALVRRGERTIVPHGDTMLRAGDRLTVLGSPAGIAELRGRGQAPRQPVDEDEIEAAAHEALAADGGTLAADAHDGTAVPGGAGQIARPPSEPADDAGAHRPS